jgi:hypothetical protein
MNDRIIPSFEEFVLLASPQQAILVTGYRAALLQVGYSLVSFSYKKSCEKSGAWELTLMFEKTWLGFTKTFTC